MCGKQGAFMGHKMQKVNLSEQIVDAMIQYIEDGKWSVGEKLPNEMELAEYFGVSRNALREALKILTNTGILVARPGIGTVVSENASFGISSRQFLRDLCSSDSVEQILETRLFIEPEMAYHACLRSTDQELQELRKSLTETTTAWKNKKLDTDAFSFHLQIAKLSRNDICASLMRTILEQLAGDKQYREFNKRVDSDFVESQFYAHEKIMSALEKRDPQLAKKIMYEHLLIRIKLINPEYLAANKENALY